MRPLAAADATGIHYRNSAYPSVTETGLKTDRSWVVDPAPRSLRSSRLVKIDVPDPWLEIYATICVQAGSDLPRTACQRQPKLRTCAKATSCAYTVPTPKPRKLALKLCALAALRWSHSRQVRAVVGRKERAR